MKDFAKSFYKSKAWQHLRDYVMKRDKMLCQDCLKRGLIIPAEEVHHIEPITESNVDNPNITLNENNLISVCRECHKARHHKKNSRRYFVDKNGKCVTR